MCREFREITLPTQKLPWEATNTLSILYSVSGTLLVLTACWKPLLNIAAHAGSSRL